MTRFYIGYVLVGMLIAKDKVELEQLYVYMLGFGSFGLDGRKQGAERLPSKP